MPGAPPLLYDEARDAAHGILDHPGADGVEVVVAASRTGLTRYAASEIIQNTLRHEVRAYVRVVDEGKLASASTNQLDGRHMRRAAQSALEAARASRPDSEFPGLPAPDEVGRPDALLRWDEATAACAPDERAEAVRGILGVARSGNVAGIYETSAHAYSVFSSTGVDCYDAHTRCITTCLVDDGGATGWGEDSSHARLEVDVERAARRAVAKAEAGAGAEDAPPGAYEVVLEAPATATLIEYLAYAGFGAKQVLDGESFLSSKAGEMVAAPSITIADDASHPRSVGIGFDFEGVPKRRTPVIAEGRAIGPVSDTRTARKLGATSTGHYSGSVELGPYASNVVLEAGDRSLDDLIAGVDEGLLVTRFHYVNVLDRPSTLLTGMTRDGTFRVSRGAIVGAVRNLRFTQNALQALATARGLGRDLAAFAPEFGSFGSTVAPAVHLGEFNFTSTTSH